MKERADEIDTSAIVTRGLDVFNEQTIETRNQWIAKKAIEAWPL